MAEVIARGLRFNVQRLGRGDHNVVFVHGLVMDNLASWYFTLANPVAKVADVVLYDLRGHGQSERTPNGYTIADMVDDLDALLDALECDQPVILMGNSFGGLLALAYAVAHPDRVSGLVLIDANINDEHWNEDITGRFTLQGEERDREVMRFAYRYAGRRSQRKRSRLAETAHELVYNTTLVDDLAKSHTHTEEDLQSVQCPVLALYGDQSELLERARRLVGSLPDCEVHWFPGCTHLLLWEATQEIRDLILDWLARRDSEAPLRKV
jgi:pimeloyl-ACP methyl ester carboxylesterase